MTTQKTTAELIALIERTTFVGSGAVYLSKDNTQAIKDRLAALEAALEECVSVLSCEHDGTRTYCDSCIALKKAKDVLNA